MTAFLLDTHILLWSTYNPEKLDAATAELLGDPANSLHFSTVSIWEVATKAARGHASFPFDATILRKAMLEQGFFELVINSFHAIATADLPAIHKDPFDRLLIAQATLENLTFLTHDATINRYPGPIRLV